MNQVRLGTRGSALALVQATQVQQLWQQTHPLPIQVQVIQTSGDVQQQVPISELGGKGIFIKELDEALVQGKIDLAVHSFKDVTSVPHSDLHLVGFLKPESICDVWVSHVHPEWDRLPARARIGTGSLRRKVWINSQHPEWDCVPIRGNVHTRLAKIHSEQLAGVVLSEAGLIRLGFLPDSQPGPRRFEWEGTQFWACRLEKEVFCPAPGQGVVAIACRKEGPFSEWVTAISDPTQTQLSKIEFALMQALGFDCHLPFGAYSEINGSQFRLQAVWQDQAKVVQRATFDSEFAEAETQILVWANEVKKRL